jgi:hypothetical protein
MNFPIGRFSSLYFINRERKSALEITTRVLNKLQLAATAPGQASLLSTDRTRGRAQGAEQGVGGGTAPTPAPYLDRAIFQPKTRCCLAASASHEVSTIRVSGWVKEASLSHSLTRMVLTSSPRRGRAISRQSGQDNHRQFKIAGRAVAYVVDRYTRCY